MKKFLLASALALSTASVLSGCFVFTGVKYSDTALKPGERSVMQIYTRPIDRDPDNSRDHPFVFVRIDGQGVHAAEPKRFDVKGSFTRNGLRLRRDDVLRDYIVDTFTEGCGPVETNSMTAEYRAFVTNRRVNDQQKPQTQAISKLGIRQTSLSDFTSAGVSVAVGGADADNDGSYDGDTACVGGAVTSLFVKPEPSPRPTTRADAREIHERINGR